MTLDMINNWLPLLSLAGVVVFGWGMWHLSRSFVTRAEHEALQARLADMEAKTDNAGQTLNVLNARLQDLPKVDAIADLRVDIAKMQGDLDGVKGIMNRVERSLSTLTEYHLNGD